MSSEGDDEMTGKKMVEFAKSRKQMPAAVIGFRGRYFWLANEWECPIEFEGVTYASVAHAFAASGTSDRVARATIDTIKDAGELRTFVREMPGKTYKHEFERVDQLAQLLKAKFSDRDLRRKLKATGKEMLVNANDYSDAIWGVCNDHGYNLLGQVLMALRSFILEEDSRSYNRGPA